MSEKPNYIGLDELAIQEGIRKPWDTILMMARNPNGIYSFTDAALSRFAALVAASSKREWVGLTDEEIYLEVNNIDRGECGWTTKFALAIEAKLREKNT
jgi:hypothetical protein